LAPSSAPSTHRPPESYDAAPPDASPIWQRNYYERMIRSEAELNRIREYITANRHVAL
jgi:hypothetical protein